LQNEIVVIRVAFIERRQKLVAHFFGRLTADVIAFQQDLAASAGAHHAMPQVLEARGIVAGSQKKKDGGGEDEYLECAANGPALTGRAFSRAATRAQRMRL
jgi:hypothetical protein